MTTGFPQQGYGQMPQMGGNPMMAGPQVPIPQQNSTLYIGNLDKTVTENLIFDRFSRYGKIIRFSIMRDKVKQESRGFAFIEFHQFKDAEAAKAGLNNEKLATRYIRVSWKGDHKKAPPEANIHVKNLDPSINQLALENAFQRFGPVLSAFLSVNEKGESNGYGYVQYKSEEDAKKCLEDLKTEKMVVGEKAVEVERFKTKAERDQIRSDNRRNLYLRDLPGTVTEDEVRKVLSKYGSIATMVVGQLPDQSSAYSLVAFTTKQEAEKALNALENNNEGVFTGQTKPFLITWHKNKAQLREERLKNRDQERDKTIYMRNIKPDIQKKDLENLLKTLGTTYGWMSLRPFEATENPTSSVRYKCQSAVIKMTSKDHVQTVLGDKEKKEVKELFIGEKPFIDIAMPKADRERMKAIQHRNKFNMGGMAPFPPQFMRPMPPVPQMYGQVQWPMFPPNQYGRGNFGPSRGGRGRGGQQRMQPQGGRPPRPQPGMMQPPYQHQAPRPMPAAQPKPAAPEPPKKLDIDMIRKNLANFKAMKPDEKRNILGEFLYPKVSKEIGHHLAPKITGMLVDFEVMTEEEILEAIDDENILKQRINEAKEALEEAEN